MSGIVNGMLLVFLKLIEGNDEVDEAAIREELGRVLGRVSGGNLEEKLGRVEFSLRVNRGGGNISRGGVVMSKVVEVGCSYDGGLENDNVRFKGSEYRVKLVCGGDEVFLCGAIRNDIYRYMYGKKVKLVEGCNVVEIGDGVEGKEKYGQLVKGKSGGVFDIWVCLE